jgi:hypothetical protein
VVDSVELIEVDDTGGGPSEELLELLNDSDDSVVPLLETEVLEEVDELLVGVGIEVAEDVEGDDDEKGGGADELEELNESFLFWKLRPRLKISYRKRDCNLGRIS